MIPVAILCGGKATRLGPLAKETPKSLIPIASKPFIQHQMELLRAQEYREIVLCAGHFGNTMRIRFPTCKCSLDGPEPLGTGGAIKKALPFLGETFFVLYGDAYLPTDYRAIEKAFFKSGKLALMTVYRNRNHGDRSNVLFEHGRILAHSKTSPVTAMQHIDYGLGVFSREAFKGMPEKFDLSSLYRDLIQRNRLGAYEVAERFYEIGSPEGLEEFRELKEAKCSLKNT